MGTQGRTEKGTEGWSRWKYGKGMGVVEVAVNGVNSFILYEMKELQLSTVKDLKVGSLGLRSLFIVEERALC